MISLRLVSSGGKIKGLHWPGCPQASEMIMTRKLYNDPIAVQAQNLEEGSVWGIVPQLEIFVSSSRVYM